jgi:predicted nucleic acid-binding protein
VSSYVIDASVVVKWFLPEPHWEAAARLRFSPALSLEAPDLLLLEVANALWKQVTRGNLELPTALRAIEALAEVPIQWSGAEKLFAEAFRLGAQTKRSIYDCTYLALALQTGNPLVTADRRFYDALQNGPFAPKVLWIEEIP